MQVVIYGQMPGGPVAPMAVVCAESAVELNHNLAVALRALAAKFDPPPEPAVQNPVFDEIVRRYDEETPDGPA